MSPPKPYHRPVGAIAKDFAEARDFEEKVADQLGVPCQTRFTAKYELDIWVPGYFLEVKEKKQPLSRRWHDALPDVPEEQLFVLDEQTVRRSLRWWPYVYFLFHDVPRQAMFLAPIWELIVNHHFSRLNRVGKGKWLIRLDDYRPLADITDLHSVAVSELLETPWLKPHCLAAYGEEIQEVAG